MAWRLGGLGQFPKGTRARSAEHLGQCLALIYDRNKQQIALDKLIEKGLSEYHDIKMTDYIIHQNPNELQPSIVLQLPGLNIRDHLGSSEKTLKPSLQSFQKT